MNATLTHLAGMTLLTGTTVAATFSAGGLRSVVDADAACISRPVPATTLTLPAASMRLLSGDHDFGGNGPAVTAWAKLEKRSVGHPGKFQDELRVRFGMRLDETGSDRTRSRGETTVLLYRATQGCYIDISRLPGTFDSNGFLAQRPGRPDPYLLAAGDSDLNPSFVSGYSIDVQHIGDDVGSYSRIAVSTKAFDIFFTG